MRTGDVEIESCICRLECREYHKLCQYMFLDPHVRHQALQGASLRGLFQIRLAIPLNFAIDFVKLSDLTCMSLSMSGIGFL